GARGDIGTGFQPPPIHPDEQVRAPLVTRPVESQPASRQFIKSDIADSLMYGSTVVLGGSENYQGLNASFAEEPLPPLVTRPVTTQPTSRPASGIDESSKGYDRGYGEGRQEGYIDGFDKGCSIGYGRGINYTVPWSIGIGVLGLIAGFVFGGRRRGRK
ncbi:MAG: hypothetical protein ABIH92_02190, partial [Nanoarchaeota archaeon]